MRMLESKQRAAGESKPRAAGEGRSTAAERLTAAQKAERDQTTAWEKAIAGQPSTAFKPYRITLTLSQGELIRHPKFGDGVVARVIDRGKAEILFKDGPRTMAHGQQV
jgi:hypothetical protein